MAKSRVWFSLMALLIVGCGNDNGDGATLVKINVSSAGISGDFTLNGGTFPGSIHNSGIITMTSNSNDLVELGKTYDDDYAVAVVTGSYASQYKLQFGGETVPANIDSTIAGNIDIQSDQNVDIDVTGVPVRFSFTLNGGAFPATEYEDAVFYLQPETGGERIYIGNSHSANDPLMFMPGTYHVIYEHETGGDQVPVNQNAIVDTIVVDIMTSGVTVDVTTVDFRFDATLDGSAFPLSQYEHAEFYLRGVQGDLVFLGKSYDLATTTKVIENTYDIVYQHQDGSSVPANTDAVIMSNVPVNTANPAQTIDIQSVSITPEYSLDNSPFAHSEYQDANIFLRGSTDNDLPYLGNTHDVNPAQVRVIQGTYDTLYRHETGNQVPQNKNALVQSGVNLNSDQVLALNVTSVDITGTFTLNGSNFSASNYESAEFYLRGEQPEDEFIFGYSTEGSGTVKIIPGTYDVVYKHDEGTNVPLNKDYIATGNILLDFTQSIRVDVPARRIRPVFTLNEDAFPESQYQRADFYLQGDSEADRIYIGVSYADSNSTLIATGNYDIVYEHIDGEQIPVNQHAIVDTLNIQ